jgi:hypothetical protein
MATLEEIMLGLKSQEKDDKKEGFSNALLGQVTPTITAQIPGIEEHHPWASPNRVSGGDSVSNTRAWRG